MAPTDFAERNKILGPPRGQEDQVIPLHIFNDGKVCISRWALTDEDLALINQTREVWLTIFSGPSQPPVWIEVKRPFARYPLALHEVFYKVDGTPKGFWAYVAGDFNPLPMVWVDGELYNISDSHKPRAVGLKKPGPGEYYFRMPDVDEADRRSTLNEAAIKNLQQYRDADEKVQKSMLENIRQNSLTSPVLLRVNIISSTEELLS